MTTASDDKQNKRNLVRFLKTLNRLQAPTAFLRDDVHFTLLTDVKRINFHCALVEKCLERRLASQTGAKIAITEEGKALLIQLLHPKDDYVSQHLQLKSKSIMKDGRRKSVTINENESPLARLFYRKSKNGVAWLNEDEFNAGERLRSDFEKSQLQPRISANWEASVASGSRGANSEADISDFALDARKRLEKSIDALGPELSGVVLDVCCFLKGLETIEKERAWPPRSAKLMLRTGLRELVRHYGLKPKSAPVATSHWGAEGYRPSTLI